MDTEDIDKFERFDVDAIGVLTTVDVDVEWLVVCILDNLGAAFIDRALDSIEVELKFPFITGEFEMEPDVMELFLELSLMD